MVKTVMSTSFIVAFSSVVFNLKSRFCKEKAWEVHARGREEGSWGVSGLHAMGGARRGSEWAGFWWQRDVGGVGNVCKWRMDAGAEGEIRR